MDQTQPILVEQKPLANPRRPGFLNLGTSFLLFWVLGASVQLAFAFASVTNEGGLSASIKVYYIVRSTIIGMYIAGFLAVLYAAFNRQQFDRCPAIWLLFGLGFSAIVTAIIQLFPENLSQQSALPHVAIGLALLLPVTACKSLPRIHVIAYWSLAVLILLEPFVELPRPISSRIFFLVIAIVGVVALGIESLVRRHSCNQLQWISLLGWGIYPLLL